MAQATARHILVDSEAKCEELKKAIEGGQGFAEVAKQHSSCPSGRNGGDLGSFGPGQMVPEFDKAVFNSELNTVIGPIKTQFGYHLLKSPAAADPMIGPAGVRNISDAGRSASYSDPAGGAINLDICRPMLSTGSMIAC